MPYKDPKRKLAWDRSHPERKHDRHSKRWVERRLSPYQRGAFVAVDGEGAYRKRPFVGPQLYTLLAASNGTTPTTLWRDRDLSTVECLEFLLALPQRYGPSIIVGFGLGYDIPHWLRDIGWSRWSRLLKHKSVWFGPYNVEWIPRKWFKVSRCPHGNHVHQRGCFRKENGAAYVKIEDTWSNFNASFEETVAKWLPHTATPALSEGKKRRQEFVLADRAFMERYNDEENRLLVGVIHRFWEARMLLGIRESGFYSPAVLAVDLLKRMKAKHHLGRYPDEMVPALYGAYFGGRIECAQIGRAHRPIYSADLNSAYPWATANLPDLSEGTWTHDDQYRSDLPWSLYRTRFDFRKFPRLFYPFAHRAENGAVAFPPCGTTWAWEPEVRAALECGDFPHHAIQILDAWHFHPKDPSAHPFSREVRKDYQRRLDLKVSDPLASDALKGELNSTYGKFAQQVTVVRNRVPPYRDMGYAGLITSAVRALLYRLVRWVGEENVPFLATDALDTTCPLEPPPFDLTPYRKGRRLKPIPPDPNELPPVIAWFISSTHDHSRDMLLFRSDALGHLKEETYLDMTSVGSGIRRLRHLPTCRCDKHDENGWEVHARGYGGKLFPFDEVEAAWARREETLTYTSPRQRFVGPRLALQRRDFASWNKWETVTKTVRLCEAGHKRTSLPRATSWKPGDTPADRLYTTKPDFAGRLPTDESALYRGKVPNDQRETAEDLTVYEDAEVDFPPDEVPQF